MDLGPSLPSFYSAAMPRSVEVVLLPRDLVSDHVEGKAVAVFDVLRATTSMTAALGAGVSEIRIFGDIEAAAEAAGKVGGPRLLCGERNCLRPDGFDLGNSPGAFRRDLHSGATIFLATTNGTRAIIAARRATALFAAAIVNASAVARRLVETGLDVTLLCAGTQGAIAMEDVLGAGAVLEAMVSNNAGKPSGDVAQMAMRLFRASRGSLPEALAAAEGGRNVISAGLAADIDYCATLDALDIVGRVYDEPLRVVQS